MWWCCSIQFSLWKSAMYCLLSLVHNDEASALFRNKQWDVHLHYADHRIVLYLKGCGVSLYTVSWVDVSSNIDLHGVVYFWQLWTVAIWLIQPMARLLSLLEQHLERMPPTVVTQATTWWETVLVLVKLQEIGLGVNLPVKVFSLLISSITYVHDVSVVWLL